MSIISPFSKKVQAYASILPMIAIVGFTANRAYFLISELNEPVLTAIWDGFVGTTRFGGPDPGPFPGTFPVTIIIAYFILPIGAAVLGVFPGVGWRPGVTLHVVAGVAVIVFVSVLVFVYRKAPPGWRNGLLWLLLMLWGLYGAFCFIEIAELMSV
jgi:hypothetical protein